MILFATNDWAGIVSATDSERRWLEDFLSVSDASGRWKGRDDNRLSLISVVTGQFLAGFLPMVLERAAKKHVRVEVVDRRTPPCSADAKADINWLRDYQMEAIFAAKKWHRGIFHHATGAGKTELMIALGELYPVRWLILVNEKTLLAQTRKRWAERTGEVVGQIGDGVWNPKRITVAMWQSVRKAMRSRLKEHKAFFASILAVAADECHGVASKSLRYIFSHLPNAYYRYGFSGTPFGRSDKKSVYVIGCIGPRIHRVRAVDLIDREVLARPKITLVEVGHPSMAGSFNDVYELAVVRSSKRYRAIERYAKKVAKPALLFVRHVTHGRILEKKLRAAGLQVEFVWGEKKTPQRQAAIRRLVHGDTDIIVCNVVFQQGIDIPELQSVIHAGGMKSIIMTLQNLGRGMRRKDSKGRVTKDEFEVIDIFDATCGCSGKTRHRSCKWLDRHSRTRKKTYLAEGYSVVVDSSLA